ncbi:MAG: hypothetical protein WC509_02800 [Candidatus Izemoplasmatales bacterium]
MTIREIVDSLDRSHRERPILRDHGRCGMPSNREVKRIVAEAKKLLLPGYFGDRGPETGGRLRTAIAIRRLHRRLVRQIVRVLRYLDGSEAACEAKHRAADLSKAFLAALPAVRTLVALDLEAHYEGDPAAFNRDQIVVAYPGFYAILVHRLAHAMDRAGIPFLPRMASEFAHRETGIDIHPGATIGERFMIDHGTGVVIGETAVIGRNVRIYQGVTLGALTTKGGQSLRGVRRHPAIGNDVTIYAGASILGGSTVVGDGATIGSNAFITVSVPAGAKVAGKIPDVPRPASAAKEKP